MSWFVHVWIHMWTGRQSWGTRSYVLQAGIWVGADLTQNLPRLTDQQIGAQTEGACPHPVVEALQVEVAEDSGVEGLVVVDRVLMKMVHGDVVAVAALAAAECHLVATVSEAPEWGGLRWRTRGPGVQQSSRDLPVLEVMEVGDLGLPGLTRSPGGHAALPWGRPRQVPHGGALAHRVQMRRTDGHAAPCCPLPVRPVRSMVARVLHGRMLCQHGRATRMPGAPNLPCMVPHHSAR